MSDVVDESASYSLLLSFSGLYQTMPEEHAFVHGVEFGGLWAQMRSGTTADIEQTCHVANRTVIERAAASQGWTAEIKPTDYPEWIAVRLMKVASAKPNPHGLRVVGKNP